jgi:hypothetical protein
LPYVALIGYTNGWSAVTRENRVAVPQTWMHKFHAMLSEGEESKTWDISPRSEKKKAQTAQGLGKTERP